MKKGVCETRPYQPTICTKTAIFGCFCANKDTFWIRTGGKDNDPVNRHPAPA